MKIVIPRYALSVSFIIKNLHVIIGNLNIITAFAVQHENRPPGMKRCSIRDEALEKPYELPRKHGYPRKPTRMIPLFMANRKGKREPAPSQGS